MRRKAAFRCCRCQSIGVEVHHIVPQHESGPDTFENAAPLCAKCHEDFGNNPAKRKEIRNMRDWWYEQVPTLFRQDTGFSQLEEKIDLLVTAITQNAASVSQLQILLGEFCERLIGGITPENSQKVASVIVNARKPFLGGSPCQMAGQACPACQDGIMDVDPTQSGVQCNKCQLYIPA